MRTLFTAAALVTVLSSSITAEACSCLAPPPPKEAVAQADAVFTGKVLAVQNVGQAKQVQFQVDRVWKAIDNAQVTISTPLNSAACGVNFEVGTSYLVYCRSSDGQLKTDLCTRTASVKNAKRDLESIGEGEQVETE